MADGSHNHRNKNDRANRTRKASASLVEIVARRWDDFENILESEGFSKKDLPAEGPGFMFEAYVFKADNRNKADNNDSEKTDESEKADEIEKAEDSNKENSDKEDESDA